jgi:predicted nucleotidyltransferase
MSMNSTLGHLPQSKRDTLRRITEVIRESAAVEMVILFGSYARGDWVEDRENEYMSDFDILVLVTSAELAADDCWFDCKERARSVGRESLVCIIVRKRPMNPGLRV